MKSIYFLFVFIAFYTTTNAQPGLQLPGNRKWDSLTLNILQQQQARLHPVARGTAARERLLGYSSISLSAPSTLYSTDSTRYYYGAIDHGNTLDNNMISSYYELFFRGQVPYTRSPAFINHPSIGFDSAYNFFDFRVASISTINRVKRTYSNGLLTKEADSMKSSDSLSYYEDGTDVYEFGYNADSQINYQNYIPYNPGFAHAATNFKRYSTGRLVADSVVDLSGPTPRLKAIFNFGYDAQGNLDTQEIRQYQYGYIGQITYRSIYTYTVNNLLQSHLEQERTNADSMIYNNYVDSFFYTGTEVTRIATYSWDRQTSNWQFRSDIYYRYHHDVLGNVDTLITGHPTATSFYIDNKTIYSFTPYNHLAQIRNYRAVGGNLNRYTDNTVNFYYEILDPLGLTSATGKSNAVIIYPNPATDQLFVKLSERPAMPVTLHIYNSIGQHITGKTIHQSLSTINIEALLPGQYFMVIQGATENQKLRFLKY